MKRLSLLFTALFLTGIFAVQAQTTSYKLTDKSSMTIKGTSTLHDWECEAEDISTKAQIDSSVLNQESGSEAFIPTLEFSAPAESIKCERGGMNKKTYSALKSDKYPTISFVLNQAELSDAAGSDSLSLNVTGDLTLAGVTKTITIPVKGLQAANDSFEFTGSYKLNMKDYDIDPPSAVFGTIRAGEEVEIVFDMFLSPIQM